MTFIVLVVLVVMFTMPVLIYVHSTVHILFQSKMEKRKEWQSIVVVGVEIGTIISTWWTNVILPFPPSPPPATSSFPFP